MKKIIVAALVGAMALSMAACGAPAEAPAPAAPADEAVSAPAEEAAAPAAEIKLAQDGILTMATNAAFPPYEFIDDAGEYVGIDVEISAAIAADLGLELEVEDIDFSSIITEVQSGKADMGAAGMTVTEERLQNVNFSETYATGVQAIVVSADSKVTSADDLYDMLDAGEDFKIGVQDSTTGHIYCGDDFGEDHVIAYPIGANAIEALKTGKVDCVVIDIEPAKAFVAANEGLSILDTPYVEEEYAIAVNKDNVALLDAINASLAKLKADGTLDAIVAKYIKAE